MNRVTDQLWITDIEKVREESTSTFDRVVTVCQESVAENVGCAYDQIDLADGPHAAGYYGGSCDYETFHRAAHTVLAALRNDEVVLVHCHAGASRSPSVSAAALAVFAGMDYDGAFGLVGKRRPETNPDELLKDHARRYIEENA